MGTMIDPAIIAAMNERFHHDALISIATTDGMIPSVRMVDGFYENGCFYTVTHALSNKMQQIGRNPNVGVCGEWFTAHGIGENIGWVCSKANAEMASRLREAFSAWYANGHVDESDPNTVILRIALTDGILYHHGTKYDIDFQELR